MASGYRTLAAGIACLLSSTAATGQTPPQVRTAGGIVQGVAGADGTVFKGIPYAAPPIGAKRWRSPEPAPGWSGVRSADSYGPPCAQAALRGMTAVSGISREDCLYLNVWTPGAGRSSSNMRRPVMLWIHGGGFVNGSGTSPTFDGSRFAAQGIVLVTINYRLGVFGFLAHPDLTKRSPHGSSGNFGLEDQIAALRWVRANIAAFGGDPSNITIFGQSAGGASVLDLVASPRAHGLFARAIIQSGAAREAIAPVPLAQAERTGAALAGEGGIAALAALDTAAVGALVDAAPRGAVRFGPVIDGYVLPRAPMTVLADPAAPKVPLLIGSNAREALGVVAEPDFDAAVRQAFGHNADAALARYRANGDDPVLGTAAQQFATDVTFRCGAVAAVSRAAGRGLPTWQYQFEQSVPGREAQGAAHSVEAPYVFGTLSPTGFSGAPYTDADRRLSALMTRYWANFARTGDPNGPGLPRWPRFTSSEPRYVRFSTALPGDVQTARDLRGEVCRLFP
ncbi:carboxylesterase/lipase family protein [Sphingomonas floccifaciens]|uniref:Carboxylic ester hydrolase n=1 Tax=Sphingomonas floccifaciens TaxID=1844115 RepID=A0ABW4N835_9SPHN